MKCIQAFTHFIYHSNNAVFVCMTAFSNAFIILLLQLVVAVVNLDFVCLSLYVNARPCYLPFLRVTILLFNAWL